MATSEAPDSGVDHAATLDFAYDTERRARVVAESVGVEVGAIGEIADSRSRADVERDGNTVRVDVAAADLVALRAGLNTWTRLVAAAEAVADAAAAAGRSRPTTHTPPGEDGTTDEPSETVGSDGNSSEPE